MKSYYFSAMFLASVSTSAFAGDFNFEVSEHVVSADVKTNISPNINMGAGYTYSDNKGQLVQFSMHMANQSGPHSFAVGPKFVKAWMDKGPNATVLAVGGEYGLQIAKNTTLNAAAYYAPSVLSFADSSGYFEYEGKAQYHFNPNMAIFVGYRKSSFDFESAPNSTFQEGIFIGGKASF
jgi:hypothetical protein